MRLFESMLENSAHVTEKSWLDGTLARFAADNADLVGRTRTLLDSVVAEPQRHARMINTLSLLEHMGSHKIMATQHSAAIDQPTLKHVAEEAHHAYFMKRQAEKTAGRALEYVAADLLAPLRRACISSGSKARRCARWVRSAAHAPHTFICR